MNSRLILVSAILYLILESVDQQKNEIRAYNIGVFPPPMLYDISNPKGKND